MINGVMHIVAAVLFGVIYMFGNMGMIWLWIAAAYLIMGVANLVVYSVKNNRKQKAAQKTEPVPTSEAV